eukprot:6453265-Ditylum_brightwellii.AAC.1
MESLATSVQQQLSTHQTNTEQMMAAQQEYIDASLQKIVAVMNNFSGNVKANSNAIDIIRERLSLSTEGPHNKRQKYGYEANADAEVMEDTDALEVNRGAHVLDPGGCGSPVMAIQDIRTGQDSTTGITGGVIENKGANQQNNCSTQRKKQ